jgi:hypothetical protein
VPERAPSQASVSGETGIGPAFVHRIGSYRQGRSLPGSSSSHRSIVNSTFVSLDGVINHMDRWHFDFVDDESDAFS